MNRKNTWAAYEHKQVKEADQFAEDYKAFLNNAKTEREAIDSILGQTFTDFELIIINDGSRDSSGCCVQSYSDSRIRYLGQENVGLAATLNKGIALARGEYIARQDQDDISLPGRFAAQVAFLDANPDCGMVGAWAEIFTEHEGGLRYHRHDRADRAHARSVSSGGSGHPALRQTGRPRAGR